ncbi:MAG: efflux RND transporter periplasmic adaptor subunit [Oscillospiraceae bacterium]|nr:efflux RND transporter periplasmic adaptor subunit [Clostridia bacterium]MBR4743095.1 efflux RND transporter periplasmic adaptor subunit [Oscillospiraceae bacterium]
MKKIILIILSAVLLLSVMTGCGGNEETASVQSVRMICGLGPVGLTNRFAGIVSAGEETKIEKDDSFRIDEIKVSVGDDVMQGDVLFTYDMEAGQLDLEKAKLTLEQMQASLSNLRSQKEDLEKQKAKASGNLELELSLEIRDVETQITEAEYNLKSKENEIAKLEASMENSAVTSPVSGRIQSINEQGGYDDRGNPLPFISIVANEGFLVKGYVNESNISSITEGGVVLIRSRVDDRTWSGVIRSIDYENPAQSSSYYYSDDTSSSSRYPFYVVLDSSDGLMLGQHVYIEPGTDAVPEEDIIQLPSYYIVDADSSSWVWAQNSSGKLEKRKLNLGGYDEAMDTYTVISGLDAGDYIAFPEDTLKAGMTCTTYSESDFMPEGNEGQFFNGAVIPEEMPVEDFIEYDTDEGFAAEAEFDAEG